MAKAVKGERTILGGVWTECAARAYNSLSERIAAYEAEGRKPPDHLLNGRHNIFASLPQG